MRKRAFAAVELALVLALLAIVASIFFPVFVRARENAAKAAEKTSCANNLHQIGVAWRQYALDYDKHLLRFSTSRDATALPSPTNKTFYWWGSWDKVTLNPREGLLYPYVKTTTVYACPEFRSAKGGSQGNLGYGYNAGYLSPTKYTDDYTVATPVSVSLGDLKNPSVTVAFADSAQFAFKNSDDQLRASSYLSPPHADYPNFHGRHTGRGNVLFCDGHVSAMMPVYRTGKFGFDYSATRFKKQHLGDLDKDGNLKTNELFVLNSSK